MEWSLALDKLSVHVGINVRLRLARLKGEKPVRILLGREHTRLFMQEKGWDYIPKGPHVYGAKGREIPIVFNCRRIHGIAVETSSTQARKARKRVGSCHTMPFSQNALPIERGFSPALHNTPYRHNIPR